MKTIHAPTLAALTALAALTCPAAQAQQVPPGARPPSTTSAPLDTSGAGKAAKVKPLAAPTDPSAPMATTAPVDSKGAVPSAAPATPAALHKADKAR